MRNTIMAIGLGVALAFGGADVAAAQQAPDRQPPGAGRGDRGTERMERRGERRPGGGMQRGPVQRGQVQRGQMQRGQMQRGQMQRGGPDGALLRGIELTAEQQARVRALRERQMTALREARPARPDAPRAEGRRPERGARRDSLSRLTDAQRSQLMQERRTEMERRRTELAAAQDRHVAELRAILTPEQRTTFDANVAAMKERQAQSRTARPDSARRRPAPR